MRLKRTPPPENPCSSSNLVSVALGRYAGAGMLLLLLILNHPEVNAQNNYYTRMAGTWANATTVWSTASHTGAACACTPGTSLGGSNTVTLYNSLTSAASLSAISGSAKITVQSGDTLTITTPTLTIGGSGNMVINAGGVKMLNGALAMSGGTAFINNGKTIINGNVTLSGSATLINNGSFIINGTLTTSGGASVGGSATIYVSGAVSGPGTTTVSAFPTTWGLTGNAMTSTHTNFLGTTDTVGISIRTNNAEKMHFFNNGSILFDTYTGTGNGLLLTGSTGLMTRLNFSGNATDVLMGNGTWGPAGNSSGWTLTGGVATSSNSVVIGSPIVGSASANMNVYGKLTTTGTLTANALTVDSNLVVNGTITSGGAITAPDLNIGQDIVTTNAPHKSMGIHFLSTLHVASGLVGIGTIAPAYPLDVTGDIHTTGTLHVDGSLNVSQLNVSSGLTTPSVTSSGTVEGGQLIADGSLLSSGRTESKGLFTADSDVVVNGNMTLSQGLKLGKALSCPTLVSGSVNADSVSAGAMAASNIFVSGLRQTGGVTLATDQNGFGQFSATSDLYIQSLPGQKQNTILNANSSGNVGVGTLSPQYKMDVAGPIHTNSTLLVDSNLVIGGNFVTQGGLNFGGSKTIAYIPAGGGNPEMFLFGDSANAARSNLRHMVPATLFCGSANLTTINGFNGTLVCGGYDAANTFHPLTMGFDGANGMIEYGGSMVLGPGGNTSGLLINYSCGRSVAICTGSSGGNVSLCTGSGGGNVFLGPTHIGTQIQTAGTINADAILTVSGKMVAQSCYITMNNWADYVFADTYKIPSLTEVEAYYKKEHHLPNVPSEKDVKETGIDVAAMDAILLKKIEELTIYMVEQNKKMNEMKVEQEKREDQLNKEIAELRKHH